MVKQNPRELQHLLFVRPDFEAQILYQILGRIKFWLQYYDFVK